MDFFANQDKARRNTRTLVILYVLAVAAIVLAVDLVLAGVWMNTGRHFARGTTLPMMLHAVPTSVYLFGALGTIIMIAAVSGFKVMELAQGGEVVAEMVGARKVPSDTRDPLEKRLLNVVEEMAIASGVRVPQVYVMDSEPGINAFAAGFDVGNSVVAVTRGTLETLNRDELQGVIGHEFSHILNGDMRLNISIMGVLAGIVFIGGIGNFLMRMSPRGGDRDNRAGIGIFAAGILLFIIGYVGLFFARLIKAAISRQREFLADASSVQFTRNPDGIAGALYRIQETSNGTLIENRHAESMSHMFFGQGINVWLSMFDTHPPLEERIKRVNPRFQPTAYRNTRQAEGAAAALDGAAKPADDATAAANKVMGVLGTLGSTGAAAGFAGDAASPALEGKRRSDQAQAWERDARQSAQLVGQLDAGKVDDAQRMLSRLPQELREAARSPASAGAVVVATLLARAPEVMQAQLAALRTANATDAGATAERAGALAPMVQQLGRAYDLMLVDLALPSLKSGSSEAQQQFLAVLQTVIAADRRLSVHAFAVYTFVKSQLTDNRGMAVKYRTLGAVIDEVSVVLSMIAHAGRQAGADAALDREVEAAFAAGANAMNLGGAKLLPVTGFTLSTVGDALEKLQYLAPLTKATLVKGLFTAVSADGTIRLLEAELMRMIGAVLDCPLPPLLGNMDLAALAA